jgi:hypothetical protein
MDRHDDLDKELRFHIDARIDDLIAEGLTPDEARRRTRLELGGVMQVKEAVRDQHLWSFIQGLLQDTFGSRSARSARPPSSRSWRCCRSHSASARTPQCSRW